MERRNRCKASMIGMSVHGRRLPSMDDEDPQAACNMSANEHFACR